MLVLIKVVLITMQTNQICQMFLQTDNFNQSKKSMMPTNKRTVELKQILYAYTNDKPAEK